MPVKDFVKYQTACPKPPKSEETLKNIKLEI
jgi:hypothetical protein